jgi:transposase InsO family protein
MEAAQFLRDLIEAVPYRVHTVLTDNGIQFTTRARDVYDGDHIFDRVCDEHGIEHRLTKVNHPWTNGQVERMNRTLKDATVKRYHYASHDQLRAHLPSSWTPTTTPAAQDAARPHALRVRLPDLDERAQNASGSTRHTTSRDRTPKRASGETGTPARPSPDTLRHTR